MGGEQDTEAAAMPSDKALVMRYGEGIARSPKDIKRGEAVFLDRRGLPLGRQPYTRRVIAWKVGIYGALVAAPILMLSGAWAWGLAVYAVGATPSVWAWYQGCGKLMAVEALMRQGHLDEAQRRLEAAAALRRRNPFGYCSLAGTMASHRGDHASALTWWRQAFPYSAGLQRELLKISIAGSLLLRGEVEAARRERDGVILPPEADEVLTGLSLERVMFVLCDPDAEPPSDDELHAWARRALEYSHTGVELAAIGWAFERAGDEDMAALLAGEAVERMHYRYLATWWPALQQWLDGRAASPAMTDPA